MLTYEHIFNTNLDHPFHVHLIKSNFPSVSISLNNVHQGYFKTTVGSSFTFSDKHEVDFFGLIVSGSRSDYGRVLEKAIFKPELVKFIRNLEGLYLARDNETNHYYWSAEDRTSFFLNPKFFKSKFLWTIAIGYVPTGEPLEGFWDFVDTSVEEELLAQVLTVDLNWSGKQLVDYVEPLTFDTFYAGSSEGIEATYKVDYFIEELQDLKNGDVLTISNGVDNITVEVKNCWTSATYALEVETTRPIVHNNIDIVNPNKKLVFAKTMVANSQEAIQLDLYDNNIQFQIKRM